MILQRTLKLLVFAMLAECPDAICRRPAHLVRAIYWARPERIVYAATAADAATAGFNDAFIYEKFDVHPMAWLSFNDRKPY